jgi:hypothetical protein
VAVSNFSNFTMVVLVPAFALPPHLNWASAATNCAFQITSSHFYIVSGHFYVESQNLQPTTELLTKILSLLKLLEQQPSLSESGLHLAWSLALSLNMLIFQVVIFSIK